MRSRFYRPVVAAMTRRAGAVRARDSCWSGSADLAVAALAAGSQLVLRGGDRLAAVGTLTREVGDRTGQFPHSARYRDAEDALAALQQIDHLFGRGALVDRGAVGEKRD